MEEEGVYLGSGAVPGIKLHNATTISLFEDKDLTTRIVVGISCALSIIGSILLIISYLVQKSRTRSREILAHISLMDFGVGLSNLIGLSVYFDKFYSENGNLIDPPAYIDYLCKTQAFFAEYCTLGSIFWTTALAAYLYIVILHHKNPKFSLYFLRFCYVLCYGLAIGITVWLLIVHRLGYAPYDSSGWCSLIVKDPATKKTSLFILIFAYDLWVYLAIVLIILFYIAIRSFVSNQMKASKKSQNISSRKFWSSMNFMDYKFILIPVTFILLRMWTCILGILTEYASVDEKKNSVVLTILLYLGGIGDSGQGFVNAILFIAFSKEARKSFKRLICYKCRRNTVQEESTTSEEGSPPTSSQDEEGTPLLYGSIEEGGSLQPAASGEASVNLDAKY